MEWEWAAAFTSGLAAWSLEWIAKAATFTSLSPWTTFPSWLTKIKSETEICEKWTPRGFTQKWSENSGSLRVICPATPSLKPK